MISRSMGFSQTLYSRKSAVGSTALKCRLAAVSKSVSQACGQTSTPGVFRFPGNPARVCEAHRSATRSGWATSIPPRRISSRNPQAVASCSPAAIRCLHARRLHLGISVIAFRMEKIFEPEDVVRFERAAQSSIASRALRYDHPAGVDEQGHVRPECLARRGHERDVPLAILPEDAPAKLHRCESTLRDRTRTPGASHRVSGGTTSRHRRARDRGVPPRATCAADGPLPCP